MKEKDLIKKKSDIPEYECECCYTADKAREKLKDQMEFLAMGFDEMYCPYCGNLVATIGSDVVIGANFYNPEHNVYARRIYECDKCNKTFMQDLTEIIYNANHDVYYTGADEYLMPDDCKELEQDIRNKIHEKMKQYTDRLKKGDDLTEWNIETWLHFAMEHIIAKWLYKKGLKK